jgi:hypothetical protein
MKLQSNNVGLDFEFFKSCLEVHLITITSRQMIIFRVKPLVPATGATSVTKNSNAFVINKGFD